MHGPCDGIEVTNNGGAGTVNFTGGTKTLNTSASTAVTLDTNTGGAVNFTGGGLNIDTTTVHRVLGDRRRDGHRQRRE